MKIVAVMLKKEPIAAAVVALTGSELIWNAISKLSQVPAVITAVCTAIAAVLTAWNQFDKWRDNRRARKLARARKESAE